MKQNKIILLLITFLLLSGCRAVQPILILNPMDMIWIPLVYIGLAWILAKGLTKDNEKFWFWFTLNLIFTPIIGLIILISRLSK